MTAVRRRQPGANGPLPEGRSPTQREAVRTTL
jgi:hypothetical protein